MPPVAEPLAVPSNVPISPTAATTAPVVATRKGSRPIRRPVPGSSIMRTLVTIGLSALALLTLAGGILLLLMWQQERSSGLLTTQLERTWDLFDTLQAVELVVACICVPLIVLWATLATVNVRRISGGRRNPIVPVVLLVVAVAGVWAVRREIVEPADAWWVAALGMGLQALLMALPIVALERVAEVAEARRRPLRATYLLGVLCLAAVQFLGALSTVESSTEPAEWGRIASYMIVLALLQVIAALAANEALRAIEVATGQRYQTRMSFSGTGTVPATPA